MSPNRKQKNPAAKSCPPTVGIRSTLRDTTDVTLYRDLRRTLFLEGSLVIHVAKLLKKGDADELRDIVGRIDAPRRLSSPFWDLPRGGPSSTVRSWLDGFMRLWSHPSPRVANWRHHEADESKKKTRETTKRWKGDEERVTRIRHLYAFVLFSTRRIGWLR